MYGIADGFAANCQESHNATSKEIQVKTLIETATEHGITVNIDFYCFIVSRVYGNPMESIQASKPIIGDILEKLLPVFGQMIQKKETEINV